MKATMNDFNMENMSLQEKIQSIFKFHNVLVIQEKLKETKGTEVDYIHSDSGYTFLINNEILKIDESGAIKSGKFLVDESFIEETKSRISKTKTMLNMIWN